MTRKISNAGFTLAELLTVVTIIALLMMASFGALSRARVLAKRTKAEAQLRELVNAWQQYYVTYGQWPSSIRPGQTVIANSSTLSPLINPNDSNNKYGVVFFNFDGTGAFNDPWGNAYQLGFEASAAGSDRNTTAFETTVALPRRFTMLP